MSGAIITQHNRTKGRLLLIALGLFVACVTGAWGAPSAYAASQVTLEVAQRFVDGNGAEASGAYTYRLTPVSDGAPLPNGASGFSDLTLRGGAKGSFGPIVYGGVGVYSYAVNNVTPERAGQMIDRSVYRIDVYVDNGGGAVVLVYAEAGGKVAEIAYRHGRDAQGKQEEPEPPEEPPVTPPVKPPVKPPVTPPTAPVRTPPSTPAARPAAPPEEPQTDPPSEPPEEIPASIPTVSDDPAQGGEDDDATLTEIEYKVPKSTYSQFDEEDRAKLEAQTGNPFVDILNGNVPLGNLNVTGVWSLVSLLFSLLAVIGAVRMIVKAIRRRRRREVDEQAGEREYERRKKKGRTLRTLVIILGVLTPPVWLFFDDLRQPMVWINKWTLYVGLLFLAHLALTIIYESRQKGREDEDEGEAAREV
jgi:hypothetical protein